MVVNRGDGGDHLQVQPPLSAQCALQVEVKPGQVPRQTRDESFPRCTLIRAPHAWSQAARGQQEWPRQ